MIYLIIIFLYGVAYLGLGIETHYLWQKTYEQAHVLEWGILLLGTLFINCLDRTEQILSELFFFYILFMTLLGFNMEWIIPFGVIVGIYYLSKLLINKSAVDFTINESVVGVLSAVIFSKFLLIYLVGALVYFFYKKPARMREHFIETIVDNSPFILLSIFSMSFFQIVAEEYYLNTNYFFKNEYIFLLCLVIFVSIIDKRVDLKLKWSVIIPAIVILTHSGSLATKWPVMAIILVIVLRQIMNELKINKQAV